MSEAVHGGFDDVVVEQSAQASYWTKAEVTDVCISARMKYWMKFHEYPKHTNAIEVRKLKRNRRTEVSGAVPDPKLYVHMKTVAGDSTFVEIPVKNMLEFITFESLTAVPELDVNTLNVKVTNSTCEIENVGEFEISSEPEVWVGLDSMESIDNRETERCIDKAISELRKQWAKEQGYYSTVWTITNVEDPEGTESATLTLSTDSEKIAFEVQAPEDITEDSPLPNFIRTVGEGLLSNVEMADVYVSFDKVDGECIATNDIGLSLHKVDAKPSLFSKIRSFF